MGFNSAFKELRIFLDSSITFSTWTQISSSAPCSGNYSACAPSLCDRRNSLLTKDTRFVFYLNTCTLEKKVKCSPYRPGVAQRVGRVIPLLFHDRGTRRGWVVSSTPRPHFNPRKTRYPLYRSLGGRQGRSGRAENLVHTGIRSQIFQPVVSRYTDWATRPTVEV